MVEPKGYISLTDPDWYSYLSAQPRVDEVNFWQPHGARGFKAVRPGELFFFKLRAPQKAIAGFGFFKRYESLPAWMAWDAFGAMNGAPDFESMLDRIIRLRGDEGEAVRSGEFQIGCVMIAAPVFFPKEAWVAPPRDWAPTGIQQGKTYQLDVGEGRRVRDECFERAAAAPYWNVESSPRIVADGSPRHGNPYLHYPRLGQGIFSFEVRDAYGGGCAVTREHSRPVLEAAHIKPYAKGGEHRVDNGLLLRSDLHRLYDQGYVTVTPDYVFKVGERLREEFKNGKSYYGLNGTEIKLPEHATLRPDRELLEWHSTELFKG